MHKYFRAIGFSEPMKARDTYNLIDDVLEKAEHRSYITDPSDEDAMLAELRVDYGNGYGVCAVGVFDEDNDFSGEALFPYFISESVSSIEQVSVEERIEGHTYAGVVDDLSVGTTLIFRLINSVEFLKYGAPQMERIPGTSVCLSGLWRGIVYPERLLVFFSHTEHDHKELIANRFPCLGFSEIVASVILVVIRSKMLETAVGKAFFYIIFPAGADLDRTALAGSESRI